MLPRCLHLAILNIECICLAFLEYLSISFNPLTFSKIATDLGRIAVIKREITTEIRKKNFAGGENISLFNSKRSSQMQAAKQVN